MNLQKLFETQAELDKHIVEEKRLQGQDLLDKKILALQVELGELANEWRGFKFWKVNPKPRNKDIECHACKGKGYFETHHNMNVSQSIKEPCNYCESTGIQERNPLLMEYVDCLHFILSIGNDLGIKNFNFIDEELPKRLQNTTYHFNQIFLSIADVRVNIEFKRLVGIADEYCAMFNLFLLLSKSLGFAWEQVERAYYAKNKINHARQEQGY